MHGVGPPPEVQVVGEVESVLVQIGLSYLHSRRSSIADQASKTINNITMPLTQRQCWNKAAMKAASLVGHF